MWAIASLVLVLAASVSAQEGALGASRALLQTTCGLNSSSLPRSKPFFQSYINNSQIVAAAGTWDFFRCAALQCSWYPFVQSILPEGADDKQYVAIVQACSNTVFNAIRQTPNLTQPEATAIDRASSICFTGSNTFTYYSNENDKKDALSCGGKLKLSAGLASCGRGLMQLLVALLAVLAVKMMW